MFTVTFKNHLLVIVCMVMVSFSALAEDKRVVYWQGEKIVDETVEASNVLGRGFNWAQNSQYHIDDDSVIYLKQAGFSVVQSVGDTGWNISITPRRYSPFNNLSAYNTAKTNLQNYLTTYENYVDAILDDIEKCPYPRVRYAADGTQSEVGYSDLEYRIGNQTPQCSWPSFKNWPTSGAHNVTNLTMENIEYNFPSISINQGTSLPTGYALLGYYASGFEGKYEAVAQTFKPAHSYLARIDVYLKRRYAEEYSDGDIYYYIANVDANGKPDMSNPVSYRYCKVNRVDVPYLYSNSSWEGLSPTSLYFNPEDIGALSTSTTYALVLEFTKKTFEDWNNSYYQVGAHSNSYADGAGYRYTYGSWQTFSSGGDLWFNVYYPSPPTGFGRNQFHSDWVEYQCYVNSKFVEDYRTIADSFTPAKEVWVYSGYSSVTYPRHLHNYKGLVEDAYSVDWEMVAEEGIDVAVCGYGTPSISATINMLSAGATPRPLLIGGVMETGEQADFAERYNICDGAMQYYWTADPGFYVP